LFLPQCDRPSFRRGHHLQNCCRYSTICLSGLTFKNQFLPFTHRFILHTVLQQQQLMHPCVGFWRSQVKTSKKKPITQTAVLCDFPFSVLAKYGIISKTRTSFLTQLSLIILRIPT
jgi:hypothetical protein